jgi:O-acetylhomoserine (thiol)-lyase
MTDIDLETVPEQAADELGFTTQQVHASAVPDAAHGARITPIYLTAGFVFDDFEHAKARFAGQDGAWVYTRLGNPTIQAAEQRIAELEHGRSGILTASGQSATFLAVLGILHAGDHFLSAPSLYEGTRSMFRETLGGFGIEVEFLDDPNDLDEWRRRLRPNTRLFFGETLPNPKNDLIDIAGIASVAHANGLPFIVDNTVPTPYQLRPIDHGVDVVVHSASKFLAGHGAALGGAIVDAGTFDWSANPDFFAHLNQPVVSLGGASWVEKFGRDAYIAHTRSTLSGRVGPTPSPFNAFLIKQGIETLSLRMRQHAANAAAVAAWLDAQPEVESVDHTSLPSNPFHALATRYLHRGNGSVFSFTLTGGEESARRLIDTVEVFTRMTHIGDVRSLILHPGTTTHAKATEEERVRNGIHPGTVRLSVGIEEIEDLIADLERGFAAIRA